MNEDIIHPARSISNSLNQIRQEAILTDLLFVCNQNSKSMLAVPAHQVIFSSLSSKLKSLFEIANQKQPYEQILITLDIVDITIMEKLVELIYVGETTVSALEQLKLIDLCTLLQLNIPLSMTTIEEIPYTDLSSCIKIDDEFNLHRKVHQTNPNECSKLTSISKSESIDEAAMLTDSLNSNVSSYVDRMLEIEYVQEMEYEIAHDQIKTLSNRNVKKRKRGMLKERSLVNDCDDGLTNNFQPHDAYKKNTALQCIFCGKYFVENICAKYQLKHHIGSVHDKLKIFNCEMCSYSSYQKCQMESHINGAHNKTKRYKCNKCEYTAAWKHNLAYHNIKKHGDATHL